MAKRVFWIVLDSVGVGAAPDAAAFGDEGADTFGSCHHSGLLQVPTFEQLGIYQIEGTTFQGQGPQGDISLLGSFGKCREQSAGKDTTVGHWEMAGIISHKAMPTYPNGFPQEVLDALEAASGRGILCNKPYSGTDVIRDYGQEHIKTGKLIVYTSADSVLQIAAHEDVVPLVELYDICKKARDIMVGDHGVGRVIARPFIGAYPNFERTVERHDYSIKPFKPTVLDAIKEAGLDCIGVGKINDIFAGCGITETTPNEGNDANMDKTIELAGRDFHGLCYVNLVDFDMYYGHRRDIPDYSKGLNAASEKIGRLIEQMRFDDLLVITADHGCDPGFRGTDHTREYVPLLVYGAARKSGVNLGIRDTFADIAASIAEALGVEYQGDGSSFLSLLS